jgi:polar amino acid transport system substrate-binding protein
MKRTPFERFPTRGVTIATIVLLGLNVAFARAEEAPVAEAATPAAAPTTTLERIRATGELTLGYRTDARPFSFRDESGQPAGYAVALCQHVADALKSELVLPSLAVEWRAVSAESRFADLERGGVDLLCGPDSVTLARRQTVSFSIAIFPGGVGAMLRADASRRLMEVLSEGPPPSRPLWRASTQVLDHRNVAVVAGTTTQSWLAERISTFKIISTISPVGNYEAGVARVIDRSSDVLFGDRAVLLDAATRSAAAGDLVVLDRHFTVEPLALALPRSDEDFRLTVDRALSRLYRSPRFLGLYAEWFGEPDSSTQAFFGVTALPE